MILSLYHSGLGGYTAMLSVSTLIFFIALFLCPNFIKLEVYNMGR